MIKPVSLYLFFIQLRFFWYVRHDRPCDWFETNEQIFIININAHEITYWSQSNYKLFELHLYAHTL